MFEWAPDFTKFYVNYLTVTIWAYHDGTYHEMKSFFVKLSNQFSAFISDEASRLIMASAEGFGTKLYIQLFPIDRKTTEAEAVVVFCPVGRSFYSIYM